MSVMMFLAGILASHLARRIGSRAVLLVGSILSIVPFVMLAVAHSKEWEIYFSTTVAGIGFGLAFAAMSILIVSVVRVEQTGVASGMNANIRTIGGSIGAALMASVVTSGVATNALPKVSGYVHGFVMLAIAGGFAALASLLLPTARNVAGSALPFTATDGSNTELALLAGHHAAMEPE